MKHKQRMQQRIRAHKARKKGHAMSNDINAKIGEMLKDLPAVYIIEWVTPPDEGAVAEERRVAKELNIVEVDFETVGFGVYKTSDDAIAVAKKMIKNKPGRELRVRAATSIGVQPNA